MTFSSGIVPGKLTGPDSQELRERGRDLAVRVQGELGTDDWEVLYQLGGQMRRVHPPGSWPIDSWRQQLLGYAPRRQDQEPQDQEPQDG